MGMMRMMAKEAHASSGSAQDALTKARHQLRSGMLGSEEGLLKLERQRRIKSISAMALGLLIIGALFFQNFQLNCNQEVFSLTGWQAITAAGIRAKGMLVTIPLAMKLSVAAGPLFAAAGMVLIYLKKPSASACCYLVAAVSPLFLLLTSSSLTQAMLSINYYEVSLGFGSGFFVTLLCGCTAAVLAMWTRGGEELARSVFLTCACVSVGSVAIITIYMLADGVPALTQIGLGNFLFGTKWQPDEAFGILPMILASIISTCGAILIGVPIGLFTAIFLSQTAPKWMAKIVRPAVELLAGIPSVIYGFFGMVIIVPFIRDMTPASTGSGLPAIIIVLSIMVLPTIVNISETALRAVPESYKEASLALGATPITTIFKVLVPAAKSGILAGIILGVGRALGETMAVIMVAGNVANMPSLWESVRPLTSGIALEMGYSSGLHRQALFSIGLVLFVFIILVNLTFTKISKKGVQMNEQ